MITNEDALGGVSIRARPVRRKGVRPDRRATVKGQGMAEYLILIYSDEQKHADGGQELWDQLMQGHTKFAENNESSLRGGHALQPTSTATTIRAQGKSQAVTDGPFAETKEALGGYYLVEAKDLDEAITIAKQVPAPHGGVEVRPVMVFD